MRGKIKGLWTQTPREKTAMVDGIGLFFGALLGANLGTLEGLGLFDYGFVVIVLAGTVMTLRIFSTSERRGYAFALLAAYVAIVAFLLFAPGQRPDGLAESDAERLAVTLAIWLGAVVIVEFSPTAGPAPDQA
jgi:predicted membrane channel-forming protein YqfA (hemolysin III family)